MELQIFPATPRRRDPRGALGKRPALLGGLMSPMGSVSPFSVRCAGWVGSGEGGRCGQTVAAPLPLLMGPSCSLWSWGLSLTPGAWDFHGGVLSMDSGQD